MKIEGFFSYFNNISSLIIYFAEINKHKITVKLNLAHTILLDRGTRENNSSKWNLKDLNEFDQNGFKETLV